MSPKSPIARYFAVFFTTKRVFGSSACYSSLLLIVPFPIGGKRSKIFKSFGTLTIVSFILLYISMYVVRSNIKVGINFCIFLSLGTYLVNDTKKTIKYGNHKIN